MAKRKMKVIIDFEIPWATDGMTEDHFDWWYKELRGNSEDMIRGLPYRTDNFEFTLEEYD